MQKHFRPTADKVIDNYEQIIGTELAKLAGKIRAMRGSDDAKKMIAETTMSVNNALASLQGGRQGNRSAGQEGSAARCESQGSACRDRGESREGRHLAQRRRREAGGNGGADVTSYIGIVKDLKSTYEELRQQLEDGSELAGDVMSRTRRSASGRPRKRARSIAIMRPNICAR